MHDDMNLYLLAEAEKGISLGLPQKAQLLMAAGFLMLGWVLVRRQMKMRKRVNQEARVANKELARIRKHKEPVLPLADAPIETQRWQGAMFDLQRELKAELDTRIAIVQTLMRQLDQRIELVSRMQTDASRSPAHTEKADGSAHADDDSVNHVSDRIVMLSNLGHTASEIASQTGISLGDVEMTLSASGRLG